MSTVSLRTDLARVVCQYRRRYLEARDEARTIVDKILHDVLHDPELTEEFVAMKLATLEDVLNPGHDELDGAAEIDRDQPGVLAQVRRQTDDFFDRVASRMKAIGFRQAELGKKLGIQQSAVSMFLRRRCRPHDETVRSLASALDCEPDDLWPGWSQRQVTELGNHVPESEKR